MIGREKETKELNRLYNSGRAELVAVYGRRRVGKTFLIGEVFEGRFTFRHAGLSPAEENSKGLLRAQLDHFYNSLRLYGMDESGKPSDWLEAFFLLEKFLQEHDDGSRQVVFLDELPWMDTPRSGFLQAFEGFWNTWGCHRKNLMVIVCGSANSWILDKLINNHGGLYDRVTWEIDLEPFTLHECEEYYRSINVHYSRYDIVQSYMIFGGIPYYMGYADGSKSLSQNVDAAFFAKKAKLSNEFDRLFDSIFANPEAEKGIVRLLAKRSMGYNRKEIVKSLGITDGGGLSRHINALLASDFIIKYVPFGMGKREEHYKLTDPFCLFYLHFLDGKRMGNTKFWQQNAQSQELVIWRGYAFENVVFNHIDQIKKALGISGVVTRSSAWTKKGSKEEKGTQIDLIIARADNVINLCEIKFYRGDFEVSKDYYHTLMNRQEILSESVSPMITIHSTLITTFGLKQNEYSDIFTDVVTMDDLFSD